MLSASHNAMPDNGIKFFARGGHKLADDVEDAHRGRGWASRGSARPAPASVACGRCADGRDRYVAHLLAVLPHRLDGLHVVVDARPRCGEPASRRDAFREAGAARHRDRRRARRPQHQRRLRLDPPGEPAARRGRARRRPRHRPRRRRRPLPGRRRDRRGRRRRPDHGDPRPGHARARRAGQGHPRRHRDEQPRHAAGARARGHRRAPDGGRRPLRARGDEGGAATPSAASSPATSSSSTTARPATAC